MYCMPYTSDGQPRLSAETHRKQARYELATLLLKELFDEAVQHANAYLTSGAIQPEDRAFVVEIAFSAKIKAHKN
jgi:hypothetical protein